MNEAKPSGDDVKTDAELIAILRELPTPLSNIEPGDWIWDNAVTIANRLEQANLEKAELKRLIRWLWNNLFEVAIIPRYRHRYPRTYQFPYMFQKFNKQPGEIEAIEAIVKGEE